MFQSTTSVGVQGGEKHLPASMVLITMAMERIARMLSASSDDD